MDTGSLNTWEFRVRCLRPTCGHLNAGYLLSPLQVLTQVLGLDSEAVFQTPLNLPTICVTLENALPLSGIQFPHLESRTNHLFNTPYTQIKLPIPSTKNKEIRIEKHYL